jgi:hypothetical protein
MSCNCNTKYDNKIPCCCSTRSVIITTSTTTTTIVPPTTTTTTIPCTCLKIFYTNPVNPNNPVPHAYSYIDCDNITVYGTLVYLESKNFCCKQITSLSTITLCQIFNLGLCSFNCNPTTTTTQIPAPPLLTTSTTSTTSTSTTSTTSTTTTTTAIPSCPSRRVVFQICNSNEIIDDNFNIYLNGTYIGAVDLNYNAQVGSVFIADTNPAITLINSDFACPLNSMVVYHFNPNLLLASNVLEMRNTQNNANGNYGFVGIRNYLLTGTNLSDPCIINNLTYSGASGDSFLLRFDYKACCETTTTSTTTTIAPTTTTTTRTPTTTSTTSTTSTTTTSTTTSTTSTTTTTTLAPLSYNFIFDSCDLGYVDLQVNSISGGSGVYEISTLTFDSYSAANSNTAWYTVSGGLMFLYQNSGTRYVIVRDKNNPTTKLIQPVTAKCCVSNIRIEVVTGTVTYSALLCNGSPISGTITTTTDLVGCVIFSSLEITGSFNLQIPGGFAYCS